MTDTARVTDAAIPAPTERATAPAPGPAPATGPAARRSSSSLELAGLSRARPAPRVAAAIGIASAMFVLAGCSTMPEDGIVTTGADGEDYVVPDGTERPVYASKEDCIADLTAQITTLEREGSSIDATPEQLCESSDEHYHGGYGAGVWLGPLLFSGSRWNSPRVNSWAPVQSGGFAAPGSVAQSDVVERAPSGAAIGSRVPLTGGFGSSGKSSGFGSSAKSASHSGSFGG